MFEEGHSFLGLLKTCFFLQSIGSLSPADLTSPILAGKLERALSTAFISSMESKYLGQYSFPRCIQPAPTRAPWRSLLAHSGFGC